MTEWLTFLILSGDGVVPFIIAHPAPHKSKVIPVEIAEYLAKFFNESQIRDAILEDIYPSAHVPSRAPTGPSAQKVQFRMAI